MSNPEYCNFNRKSNSFFALVKIPIQQNEVNKKIIV